MKVATKNRLISRNFIRYLVAGLLLAVGFSASLGMKSYFQAAISDKEGKGVYDISYIYDFFFLDIGRLGVVVVPCLALWYFLRLRQAKNNSSSADQISTRHRGRKLLLLTGFVVSLGLNLYIQAVITRDGVYADATGTGGEISAGQLILFFASAMGILAFPGVALWSRLRRLKVEEQPRGSMVWVRRSALWVVIPILLILLILLIGTPIGW